MSMMGPLGQGSSSSTDIVTALQGITRQLTAWVQAFKGRNIFGSFTLAAANTTVVAQPAVQANSFVTFTPTNASAATLQGSPKAVFLLSISPGVSFSLETANAASATGLETFSYKLESPA